MPQTYDAIVIGGGIVGAAAAYHLVQAGARTLLFDRDEPGRATDAGAGILAPAINRRDPDLWVDFALKAVDYYPPLVEALAAAGAGETSYARCGMLLVAAEEEELEPFTQAQATIAERQRQRGVPAPADLYPVKPEEARSLFPPLGPICAGLYYRQAARVDGRQMAQAMRRAAQRQGLQVAPVGVEALQMDRSRVTGVVAQGEVHGAGAVIVAGGAWSGRFGQQLGVAIPVEPQRGQIVHLSLPDAPTGDWPIVGAFKDQYIVTWPGGRIAAGATRETGSGFAPHATAAGIHAVLGEALRVAPGLADARIAEIRVGLRPMTPDGMPVLGPVPGVAGVFLATGHGPTGLQLGPYSGKLVADLALGHPAEVDLSPFSVTRFQ
ncbi:NAD(P)/FAD-dependent oxidoreductase [Litorilinea aerophila]|uniref:FAD-dependent oxidoreductase n=1 Tax=Litorilinea aerophila TaxID=1204385 RepID=A0A540VBF3_9CHLR|nr:FAD-dependent oxidoreductase [Litorilinea aerophila]